MIDLKEIKMRAEAIVDGASWLEPSDSFEDSWGITEIISIVVEKDVPSLIAEVERLRGILGEK